MGVLRIILWDQLSLSISSLEGINKKKDLILLCETYKEASYVAHHKKKLVFLFSSMRHFAEDLKKRGLPLLYVKIDDPQNTGSLKEEIKKTLKEGKYTHLCVTQPSEYHILKEFESSAKEGLFSLEVRADTRFLCGIEEFSQWANGRESLRMEHFYHEMRKKTGILMEGKTPIGASWNYDSENRSPPQKGIVTKKPYTQAPDKITEEVIKTVEKYFSSHFGDIYPFNIPCTRQGALAVLKHFIEERLSSFGKYQDAMLEGEPWMFHAHISWYLNAGLLLPKECIDAAEDAYFEKKASLSSVEGFIRQILGWREYVRGIYWLKMPEYKESNFFNSTRDLPSFYWDGNTKMRCLSETILQTKKYAYAHHIQRLMVLGNFALLLGVDPKQVNEWFWIVYLDAYEWVELPNVTGMALFADGGFLASKPYAASANYINKMSDYCKKCPYNPKKRTGEDACPFNYLYWDFLSRNKNKLASNPRLKMVYKTYNQIDKREKEVIRKNTIFFINKLSENKF